VIACCVCDHAVRFTGEADAWAAGWGSVRIDLVRRRWWCPECWQPPRLVILAPPAIVAPEKLLEAAESQRRRREVARLLARLIEIDPPRGEAYALAIAERCSAGKVGAFWRRELEGLPLSAPVPVKTTKARKVAQKDQAA